MPSSKNNVIDRPSLADQMAADLAAPPKLDVEPIRKLISRWIMISTERSILAKRVEDIDAEIKDISTIRIPEILDQAGVPALTLDGKKISIKDEVYPYVKEEDRPAFFTWLREHNLDGIIKNEVKVTFGAKQDQEAIALARQLQEDDYDVSQKETVHPQTLKAFVKEQLERLDKGEGDPLPPVLSINPVRLTIVK